MAALDRNLCRYALPKTEMPCQRKTRVQGVPSSHKLDKRFVKDEVKYV